MECDVADAKKFKCCFFVHVRVATIILGLWHMIVNFLVLGFLVASSLSPELPWHSLQPSRPLDRDDDIVLFTTVNSNTDSSSTEIQYGPLSVNSTTTVRQKNPCVVFAVVICTLFIAMTMVYGAIKNHPGYLMPFFCLQMFDFCFMCLTIVSYLNYAPDVKLWIKVQEMEDFPGMNRLLQIDDQWLMLLFVIIFILFLTVKAYMISLVWTMYQYLKLVNAKRHTVHMSTEMLLPPTYEEAMNMFQNEPAPPSYMA